MRETSIERERAKQHESQASGGAPLDCIGYTVPLSNTPSVSGRRGCSCLSLFTLTLTYAFSPWIVIPLTHCLSFTRCLSKSLTRSFSLCPPHTLSLSMILSHTHCLSHSSPLSLLLSLSHSLLSLSLIVSLSRAFVCSLSLSQVSHLHVQSHTGYPGSRA